MKNLFTHISVLLLCVCIASFCLVCMYVYVHMCTCGFETVSKFPGSLVTKDDLEPLVLMPDANMASFRWCWRWLKVSCTSGKHSSNGLANPAKPAQKKKKKKLFGGQNKAQAKLDSRSPLEDVAFIYSWGTQDMQSWLVSLRSHRHLSEATIHTWAVSLPSVCSYSLWNGKCSCWSCRWVHTFLLLVPSFYPKTPVICGCPPQCHLRQL